MKRNALRWHLLTAALVCSGVVDAQTTFPTGSPTQATSLGTTARRAPGGTATGTPTAGTTTTGTATTGTTSTGTAATGATTGSATTPPTLSPGQTQVAARVAAPFAGLAGSTDNAVALATALRTGSAATLTFASTDATGAATTTTTTITPPTKPMGWGNVSHALALTQVALANNGVAKPTSADLQAALLGGDATRADGTKVTLAGVLQQRAAGTGWGRIAASYGTTMGKAQQALHAPTKGTTTATAKGSTASTSAVTTAAGATSPRGITAATGMASSRGLTTAGGTAAGVHGAKGLTTASGATGATGIVSGNGNGFGRGIVTAAGGGTAPGNSALHRASASGVVPAGGSSGPATAVGGHGESGNSQGRGKGGG